MTADELVEKTEALLPKASDGEWAVSGAVTVEGHAMVVGGSGQNFGLVADCCLDADAAYLVAVQPQNIALLLSDRASSADRIAEMEKENARLRGVATDRLYMMHAYANMLGETGLKVAKMWDAKGVQRVHFDWDPEAAKLTGEERAALILALEDAPRTPMNFGDSNRKTYDFSKPEELDAAIQDSRAALGGRSE